MNIKANGRSALILATGLFVCFAGPSQAAAGADNATATSKSGNAAAAPLALDKNLKRPTGKATRTANPARLRRNPPRTRNLPRTRKPLHLTSPPTMAARRPPFRHRWPTPTRNCRPPTRRPATPRRCRREPTISLQADGPAGAKADNGTGDGTQLVAADQLNDVDRALHEGNPPPAPVVLASADPRAAPVLASSPESSAWDQTSLIGKIFIGFGALLTMASAARMFMA